MIASESDDSWQRLALLRWTRFLSVGGWVAHKNAVVAFFNLVNSPGVVVSALQSAPKAHSYSVGLETHEVTGISPQSSTVAQLLNGFASSGTL